MLLSLCCCHVAVVSAVFHFDVSLALSSISCYCFGCATWYIRSWPCYALPVYALAYTCVLAVAFCVAFVLVLILALAFALVIIAFAGSADSNGVVC